MRHIHFITVAVLASAGIPAMAQNFDPTVEVTKDFVSEMADARKVDVKSALPDSLTSFNLDFDYEVFSKPYKGSYTFTPYNVMFIADDEPQKRPFFYLNAGAGYALHPVLTAVVSPRLGRRFNMDIYQDLGGYFGKYEKYDGYDLSEQAGVRGSLRQDSFDLLFDVHYHGLMVRDLALESGMYHNFGGSARLTSSDMKANWMNYDVTASYNVARELAGPAPITENEFLLYGLLAPALQYRRLRFVLDFNTGYRGYSGAMDDALYSIETAPHFLFNLWKLRFNLGAKLSYLSGKGRNTMHAYPDIRLDLRLFKDRLDIFAGVTGGERLNSYSSFKNENHHFNIAYAVGGQGDILSCSRERYNAFVGIGGSIGSVFQYDLRAGHSRMESAAMMGIDAAGTSATLVLADYEMNYIDATTTVKTIPVDFSLGLHLKDADIDRTKAFSLPVLTSDASLTYNWHRRLFVGASYALRTARMTEGYMLDPVHLLGLSFELRTGRDVSLWLRGDNLLNRRIETIPGVVETGLGNGIAFTAGIRLDLR